MNYIINDKGESVIAFGSDYSIARMRITYPKLIEKLDSLYCDSCDCYGRAIDRAIEAIRNAGITSYAETKSILACSLYANEQTGSVTSLVMQC